MKGKGVADLVIGQTYGELEIIGLEKEFRSGRMRLVAKCACSCGKPCRPLASNVATGLSQSCGCGGGPMAQFRSRQKGQPLTEWTETKCFVGKLLVTGAWYYPDREDIKLSMRNRTFVELQCLWCQRHMLWEVGDASRREQAGRVESCGCITSPKYVTIEEKAERRRSYRQTGKEIAAERDEVLQLTGREGEFLSYRKQGGKHKRHKDGDK